SERDVGDKNNKRNRSNKDEISERDVGDKNNKRNRSNKDEISDNIGNSNKGDNNKGITNKGISNSTNIRDKYDFCREYDLPVKGMDTGYRLYKHLSRKGYSNRGRGVNNRGILEGVNDIGNRVEGVSDRGIVKGVIDKSSKEEGVIKSTSKEEGVINNNIKQHPLNNNNIDKHPFNNTDTLTLHKVFSKAFNYNISLRQKDGSYICIRSGVKVYIHPSSACYNKRYKKIVYVDLYGGDRIYTRIVKGVDYNNDVLEGVNDREGVDDNGLMIEVINKRVLMISKGVNYNIVYYKGVNDRGNE
ncbi:hypothetical protein CWI38_2725p0010, partial [Hamiltosporidium tvaerminnensis]